MCSVWTAQLLIGIVERSIDAYVGFFKRFDSKSPMRPEDVVKLSGMDEREDVQRCHCSQDGQV